MHALGTLKRTQYTIQNNTPKKMVRSTENTHSGQTFDGYGRICLAKKSQRFNGLRKQLRDEIYNQYIYVFTQTPTFAQNH